MGTTSLTNANFEATTSREGIVVIDAWAPWCGPCRQFAPVFEKASERHAKHVFVKLDTEAEKELRARLGIQHIPSLLVYRDGIPLYNAPGSPPAEALDELVAQAEALDMDEVRERRRREAEERRRTGATESNQESPAGS